jgi:hypothetical protein
MTLPAWLPPIQAYSSYNGDWDRFFSDSYSIFCADFKNSTTLFYGKRIVYDNRVVYDGKEEGFWHIISRFDYGQNERLPDLRRCERTPWVKTIIENSQDPAVQVWQNRRNRQVRTLLYLEEADYLITLAEKPHITTLITAYIVDSQRAKQTIKREQKEYAEYLKMQAPPSH